MTTKRVIGITGGIASGKTTVSNYLKKMGYPVLDADQVVHELQAKGGRLYQALLQAFGPDILAEDGQLDRPKLAKLIFGNAKEQAKSAALQDEIIRQELQKACQELAQTEDLFFIDIPLLFEKAYEDWFDAVWLVYVKPENQLKRLMARNDLTEEEAQLRLRSQMSLEDKKKLTPYIIDNNASLQETYAQLDSYLAGLGQDD